MAKKFAGFKPETMKNKILPALGYNGPTDQKSVNEFLAANPAAAAKMGKFTLAARRAVEGEPVKMAAGGKASSANVMTKAITADPTKLAITPEVAANKGGPETQIAQGTGQVAAAQQAQAQQAQPAAAAQATPAQPAAQVQAQQAAPAVAQATQQMQGAQGQVSQQAQMQAEQADPTQASSLGLQAAQGQAQTVQGAPTRTLDQDELVSGSTVDMQQVDQTLVQAQSKLHLCRTRWQT